MVREIILKPEYLDERVRIRLVLPVFFKEVVGENLVHLDKMLLFKGEDHFEALRKNYPNGYRKTGTIRYKKGYVRLPFGKMLPVYKTEEFNQGARPRGIVTIDEVVACQLNEITPDEWLHDGFNSQTELFEGMKTYYSDITPESLVSYYKFQKYEPKPSRRELKRLLRILK